MINEQVYLQVGKGAIFFDIFQKYQRLQLILLIRVLQSKRSISLCTNS
jgi:hypothetical protein